jgi:hypothetical protein
MVYDTQNYWGCRICPSSGILKIRKPSVLDLVLPLPFILYSSILCMLHHSFLTAQFPVTSLGLFLLPGAYIAIVV